MSSLPEINQSLGTTQVPSTLQGWHSWMQQGTSSALVGFWCLSHLLGVLQAIVLQMLWGALEVVYMPVLVCCLLLLWCGECLWISL